MEVSIINGEGHGLLHHALRDAVRWSLVPRNVVGLVTHPGGPGHPPRRAYHEFRVLSPDEAGRPANGHGQRLGALDVLAVTTAMRQGRLLRLRWIDVDLRRVAAARSPAQDHVAAARSCSIHCG